MVPLPRFTDPSPTSYIAYCAGEKALEDWPAGNRVSSWARLLRAGDPEALRSALWAGLAAFPEPGDAAFRETLRLWAVALLRARAPVGGDLSLPAMDDDQGEMEMTTLLEANLAKWEAGVMERGVAQGRAEGVERGRAEGVERGRAEERERLRRLAQRLDPEMAEQVSRLLDQGD